MAQIGELIRAARQKRGWSTRVLSDKCGVHNSIISNIERGHTDDPKFSTVFKLCKTLKIRIATVDPAPEEKAAVEA